ncbi:BlaI/MecI/CopY family transcriptional regulator [Parablautia muri]|uniref:BlaI/MecI/CopY family transcriptional regulator n=1 Tax=Parablautia muri TaxID=2320879 RepID=A0A9X5BGJ4_9FIRM|nr:BlaI/MecI/CopY family transcriptional regulator [Parablautia muri]NBJ93649.1 BlaI/MecI/CopY family transcriptional regulator [Parablautia muri]
MGNYKLGEAEMKFAEIIWEREPLTSSELVKVCESKMNWKKSTTYTVLKKMCEKGIFQNENAVVSAKMSREEFYGVQSRKYVEDVFSGSLPRFLTAFCNGRKLSAEEVGEMEKWIDEYREDYLEGGMKG